MVCAFAACRLGASSKEATATGWLVVSGAVCAPEGGALVLKAMRLATLLDDKGAVRIPKIQLVLGGVATPVNATYDAASQTFSVSVPANTATGFYDAVITRLSDGAQEKVSPALQVLGEPQIANITGQAACASSTAQIFTITGGNFGPQTTVTLAGDAAPLATTTNASGSSISATAPTAGHTAGVYAITVSNGGTQCRATSADGVGFVVKDPPTVTSTAFGPVLHSGLAVRSAAVTVRVQGANLSNGTLVSVGGVAASSVTARSDGGIDAVFPPESLPTASAPIAVANGACSVSQGAVQAAEPTMTIDHTSPTALPANGVGGFVDAFGDFSHASLSPATSPSFEVDLDPDPITTNFVSLGAFVRLDGQKKAYRFRSVAMAAGTYDVRMIAGDDEAYASGKLTVTGAGALPRIVWKKQDWITSGTDQTVDVVGCGFDAAALAFSLVDGSGAAAGTVTHTAPAEQAAGTWAADKFVCETAGAKLFLTTLTVHAAQAGTLRLRVTSGAIASDDLYPLVAYGSAPALHAPDGGSQIFVDAGVALNVPRRNAASVVATDPTGRKYLYVVGGDISATLTADPRSVGANTSTYEYTAIAYDHQLIGMESTTAIDLGLTATYGAALFADGSRVYLLGGTATGASGNASTQVAVAKIKNPLAASPTTPFGQIDTWAASGVTLGTGVYGLSASIAETSGRRSVVAFGGVTQSSDNSYLNTSYSGALNNDGTISAFAQTSYTGWGTLGVSNQAKSVGQAFAPMVVVDFADASTLNAIGTALTAEKKARLLFGLFDSAATNTQELWIASDGTIINSNLQSESGGGLTTSQPYYGFGWFNGPIGVLLGGINGSISSVVTVPFDSSLSLSSTSVVSTLSSPLPQPRGLAATAFVAPYLYDMSGFICTAPDCNTETTSRALAGDGLVTELQ
jgi:hypothetical protein